MPQLSASPPASLPAPRTGGFPPLPHRPADHAALPLRGLTILAVEDSRYSSDAMRLLCQRSGARLRRAEDLAAATAHLRLYRPDVVFIDLGLPDGSGIDLITALAAKGGPLLFAMSADPSRAEEATAAGARAFIAKPLSALDVFQSLILTHLEDGPQRGGQGSGRITPDPLALREVLKHAVERLKSTSGGGNRAWLAGFLTGLAGQSQDPHLASLAHDLLAMTEGASGSLASALEARLNPATSPFR